VRRARGRARSSTASDDGKERRLAREQVPGIELLSPLGMLHEAVRTLAMPEDELLGLVTDLRWRGNFAPPRMDPLSAGYAELLRRLGVPW
jgi:hypothetical protein